MAEDLTASLASPSMEPLSHRGLARLSWIDTLYSSTCALGGAGLGWAGAAGVSRLRESERAGKSPGVGSLRGQGAGSPGGTVPGGGTGRPGSPVCHYLLCNAAPQGQGGGRIQAKAASEWVSLLPAVSRGPGLFSGAPSPWMRAPLLLSVTAGCSGKRFPQPLAFRQCPCSGGGTAPGSPLLGSQSPGQVMETGRLSAGAAGSRR